MIEGLYSRRSNLVIGFHGCDKSIADEVVAGRLELIPSTNDYDWLGSGIYFWENNEARALQFVQELKARNSSIETPAVLGAVIDLGFCMDLTDSLYFNEIKEAYDVMVDLFDKSEIPLPKNTSIGTSEDLLLRKLDRAVIETVHQINKTANNKAYDSVKGMFWEGEKLYPNAGFREKNHIQICVRNPNCIKGYFLPRKYNSDFSNP